MDRFLRYSLEHERPIRAVLVLSGQMVQKTLTVLKLEENAVTLRLGAQKKLLLVPLLDIFSCDYARGDHGEE